MMWALILLKCSLLRGWKEHKTNSESKVCQYGVSIEAWQGSQEYGTCTEPDLEVIKCSHVGRTVVLSGEPHPHAISLLGRQLAEPWWPPLPLQLGSRWEEGVWGEGGEGQCLLWAPLSSYPRLPVSSRGERTDDQTALLLQQTGATLEEAVGVWECPVREKAGCPASNARWPAREIKSTLQRNRKCESEVSFLVLW